MKMIKQNFMSIIIIILTVCVAYCSVFMVKQIPKSKIELVDTYGERECLKDIKISGVLADNFHKRKFVISDEKVKSNFSAISEGERKELMAYLSDELINNKIINTHISIVLQEDDIPSTAKTVTTNKVDAIFRVSSYEENNNKQQEFLFELDMIYQTQEKKFSIDYDPNSNHLLPSSSSFSAYVGPEYFDRKILRKNPDTGRIFAFTKSGADCAGYGGAYDITEQIENDYDNPEEFTDIKNIAPIDLKNGKVRIAGMETAGNKLLFITCENGEVILKPFDLDENEFLDDINLGYQKFADKERSHDFKYCCDIDNQYINLAFETKDSDYNNDIRIMTVVYDAEKNNIALQSTEDYFENNYFFLQKINMKYKNDKLFMIREYFISDYPKKYNDGTLTKKVLLVTVLGEGETLYEGVVKTDATDDSEFRGRPNVLQGEIYYRDYYALTLE